MSRIELEVVADERDAAPRAAELIAAAGRRAVEDHGSFALAVSGGRTPWGMLAILSDRGDMPWAETSLFQVDERVAAPGDQERNLTHIVLALSMENQAAIRPMPVTHRNLEAAAGQYEESLPERLDLVHLGLGADGHTASLVPEDPVLDVADRRVALTDSAYQGHRRMTLTYPAIAAAGEVLWLVTGPGKREALARLLDGDRSIPAGRVENGRMLLVADEAAAGPMAAA